MAEEAKTEVQNEETKGAEIVEIDPDQVVDVASFGGDTPKQEASASEGPVDEPIKDSISKEAMEKLQNIKNTSEQLHVGVGALETQKLQMCSQILQLRNETETVAKVALMEAGISEDKLEEYRVDIKTGKIVATKDIPQMQQK